MKILILGGGLMGVTTAYQLARDGHEVTVVDREAEPATGASYANAALIAPSHAFSWAAPGAPLALMKSVFQTALPIKMRPRMDPVLWSWGWRLGAISQDGAIGLRPRSQRFLWAKPPLERSCRSQRPPTWPRRRSTTPTCRKPTT